MFYRTTFHKTFLLANVNEHIISYAITILYSTCDDYKEKTYQTLANEYHSTETTTNNTQKLDKLNSI